MLVCQVLKISGPDIIASMRIREVLVLTTSSTEETPKASQHIILA